MGLQDVELVKNMFDNLSYEDLLKCKDKLDFAISRAFNVNQKVLHSHIPTEYVGYHKTFLDTNSVEYAGIRAELEILAMKSQRSGTPDSRWLTTTNLPYTWTSGKGHKTVKSPTDISTYPFMKQLMEDINLKFNADLNSCLVNYYKTGNSTVRYHDDNEEDIDQTQPICILSVGSERTINFLYQDQHHQSKPVHSVTPGDGSLYEMKAGCQQIFKHSVKKDPSVSGERYCLSFRRRIMADDTKLSNSDEFLDAFSSRIAGNRLASRGRKVINVSQSGAKIKDMLHNMEYFHAQNPAAPHVDKILFSLGTNDIKYSRHGVLHLKQIIINLISRAKELFPGCIILMHSCLPMRNLYGYTCPNVLNFNRLINNLCELYNCMYVDCFRYFLSPDGYDYNRYLYYDWLHLNDVGLGVLARCLGAVVNRGSFNHVVSNF